MCAFFQDVGTAFKDLAENGMNLDKLQDEVGVDAREPLPKPPPLRSTPTKAPREAAEPAPAAPAPLAEATEVARQRAEQLLAQSGDFFAGASPRARGRRGARRAAGGRAGRAGAPAPAAATPASPKPRRRPSPWASALAAPPAAPKPPTPAAAAPTPAAPKPAAPKPAAPKPAAPRPGGRRGPGPRRPKPAAPKPAAPKPAESRLAAAFKSTTSALAGAPRGSSARERAWEAEAAGRSPAARLEAEVVELRSGAARDAEALVKLRREAAGTRRAADVAQAERDACAAELEAVALGRSAPAEADVAARLADEAARELRASRSRALDAEAARDAALDKRRPRRPRRVASGVAEALALARDAGELRGLLRSALREKRRLEVAVDELKGAEVKLGATSATRGEATRRCARARRAALVGGAAPRAAPAAPGRRRTRATPSTCGPSCARPFGTAPRTGAATTRLLPVLRSLLGLPHDHVAHNLDALGATGSGGEFALALLNAAAKAAAAPRRPGDAGRGARAERDAARGAAADLRAERDASDRAAAARDGERRAYVANLEASVRWRRGRRSAPRRRTTSSASPPRRTARRSTRSTRRATRRRSAAKADAGLDGEQLEYVRTTIVCFLKAREPLLKKQLLPVLARVLKLDPADERAAALLDVVV
ncbi:hypothetical protein JL720_15355 [Aureococcus anophagefferens]|nr:hypothetical protein JL720_15355 [Aureococcus anophagefferens]